MGRVVLLIMDWLLGTVFHGGNLDIGDCLCAGQSKNRPTAVEGKLEYIKAEHNETALMLV